MRDETSPRRSTARMTARWTTIRTAAHAIAAATLVVLGLAPAGARAQAVASRGMTSNGAVAEAGGPTHASPGSPGNGSTVLRPGDVVRLKIYREPDMSGDYEVNEEGMAVFPEVGAVHVSEVTTDSLQRLLLSTYSKYLRDPAIEVTPLRRITVLGAVKNPGLYPIDPTMTVADAVALAGGPTPDGNPKRLTLIRGGKKQNVTITAQEQVAATPIRSGDELFIPERSWLSRNGYVVGAAIGAATIVATTLITHY